MSTTTFEPLPSDLRSLGDEGFREAMNVRRERAKEIAALVEDGAEVKSSHVSELKSLNDDLKRMGDFVEAEQWPWMTKHPGHPTGERGSRFGEKAVPDTGPGTAPWTLTTKGVEELWEGAVGGKFVKVGGTKLAAFPDPIGRSVRSEYLFLPEEGVRVADFIPAVRVAAPAISYYQMQSFVNSAAAVAPGADKPESSAVFAEEVANIVKIAHYARVHDEVIKDLSNWHKVLSRTLIRGLIAEENRQLLTATGAGEDMVGLVPSAGLSVTRDTTNESRLDCILRAITELRVGGYLEPTLIVLHPQDYYEARIEKADTSGDYLAGDPLSAAANQLWGVRVLVTTSMTEGTGLVGNLPAAANIFWREAPIFEVHPGGGGEAGWRANITLVRAEERMVLAVHEPAALVEVNLL